MHIRRHALALALAAGIMAPTAATAAVAWAGPAAGPAASLGAAKTPRTPQPPKATKAPKPAKPAKVVKVEFTASGVVTAVDAGAGTVTVAVKGGTKDVRGRTVVIVLAPGARIVVDDAPATAGDVEVGFRITVRGTRTGAVHTASKVQASAPEPTPTPTPELTPEPTPSAPVEEPGA